MNYLINFFSEVFTTIGLALGIISDDLDNSNFKVVGILLDPPSGSTVMVGQEITATVIYQSDLYTSRSIHLWVMPNSDEVGGSYDPSGLELPNGRLTRHFSLSAEGHLNEISVQVGYKSGEEIFSQNKIVDYKVVANPELEKLRGDGVDSKLMIDKIVVDKFEIVTKNPKIKVNSEVDVVVSYRNTSSNGVRIWAVPQAEHEFPVQYASSNRITKAHGKITKWFTVHEATRIEGIYVYMLNEADELLCEQWLEMPIEFYA